MSVAKSQNEKLVEFFQTGKSLTEAQARARYGVANLTARIAELRAEGYSIYKNTSKEKGTSYKLGKPTRAMIAAAYSLMGAQAFA
jgi:hypothetical protein